MDESIKKNRYRRISKNTANMMIALAVFFDLVEFLLELIPFAGLILAYIPDVFALVSFFIWFLACGVKLGRYKSGAKFWVTSITELLPIPYLDFCLTTIGVALTIGATWREDGPAEIDGVTDTVGVAIKATGGGAKSPKVGKISGAVGKVAKK
jgi:hypothetical protein